MMRAAWKVLGCDELGSVSMRRDASEVLLV